jgi:hypothetical protein
MKINKLGMKLSNILLEGFGSGEFKKAPTGNNDGFKPAPVTGNDSFKPAPVTGNNGFKPAPINGNDFKVSPTYQPSTSAGSKYWDVAKAAGDALVKSKDANAMATQDGKFAVYNTGRVYAVNAKGKFMGTMEITGDKSYKIKYDDGDVYDSATSKVTKTSQLIDVVIKPEEIVNGSKLVKIGMRGDIVKQIQNLLIKKGFKNISKSGQVDGIYGSRTKQAVIDFQIKNELTHDGIVGKNTWGKLNSESQYVDTSDMDTPESLAARDAAVKADADAAAQKQNNLPNKLQEEIRKIVYKNLRSLIK